MRPLIIVGIFVGLFLSCGLAGQILDYPRDTSFTVWSAGQKISREFPMAVPVREFEDFPILSERDINYADTGTRDLRMDIIQVGKIDPLFDTG